MTATPSPLLLAAISYCRESYLAQDDAIDGDDFFVEHPEYAADIESAKDALDTARLSKAARPECDDCEGSGTQSEWTYSHFGPHSEKRECHCDNGRVRVIPVVYRGAVELPVAAE